MSVAPRGSDCGGGATADVEQQSAGARKSVPPLPPRRCGCACWAMLTRRRRPLVLLALLAAAGLLAGLLGGLLPRGGGGGGAPPPQLVVVLVVSRGWAAGSTPGGAGRSVVLVNGTSPGPVLRVPTGWRLRVRLVNALDDSTTIHLHGLNTAATPWADGTPGLSQCPLGNGTGSNTLDYDVLVTVVRHRQRQWQWPRFLPAPHSRAPPRRPRGRTCTTGTTGSRRWTGSTAC